jgi:hypothetical protein
MLNHFELAWGTLIGRGHVRTGKNNQDACHARADGKTLVAVVCDGCSGGRHSEVGAAIGARLLVETLNRNLASADASERSPESLAGARFWEAVRREMLRDLRRIARRLGGNLPQLIHEYFLFTAVGAVVTPRHAALFSLGDGLLVLNGGLLRLGPFPGNQPPYLGYALDERMARRFPPDALRFQVHQVFPTEALRSLLLGTDGVEDLVTLGALRRFWEDDRCFTNPDMIRRQLALIGREPGLLSDDTTLIVIRRKPGEARHGA